MCPEHLVEEELQQSMYSVNMTPRAPVPHLHKFQINPQQIKTQANGNHFLYLFLLLKWTEGSYFLGSFLTCEYYIIRRNKDFSKIKERKQLNENIAAQSRESLHWGYIFRKLGYYTLSSYLRPYFYHSLQSRKHKSLAKI